MEKAGLDDPVTEKQDNVGLTSLKRCQMKKIFRYPRAVKPNDTIGLPVLVVISDASERAFGASTYVR